MRKTRAFVWLAAILAGAYGLPSLVGAFAVGDVTPLFRAASFVVGSLLVAGAVLLLRAPRVGVCLLWASAGLYALVMLVPSLQRHGVSAFSALMGAFYLSLGIRVALAAFAHAAVRVHHG